MWVRPVNQTAKKFFKNTAGTVGLARFPSAWRFRGNFTWVSHGEGLNTQKQRHCGRCRYVCVGQGYCLITVLYFAFRSPAFDAVAFMLLLLVGWDEPLLV